MSTSTLTVDDVITIIKEYKGDPPDFLEKHGAWLLTIVGVGVGCVGTLLAYFLKSRCKKIKVCGLECDRDVLALDPKEINSVEPKPSPEAVSSSPLE